MNEQNHIKNGDVFRWWYADNNSGEGAGIAQKIQDLKMS